MTAVSPRDVLDFWFAAGEEKWWAKSDAFDDDIRHRFGAAHADAVAGKLDGWLSEPAGALALVIVLDQFSRNLYRQDHRAWAQDARAREVMREAMKRRYDVELPLTARKWIYMPYMHSEILADQEEGLPHFASLDDANTMKFADEHADIIRRFGRFPHRNAVLGRVSSPQEQDFLDQGGFAG